MKTLEISDILKKPRCPKCGSSNVSKITMGLPKIGKQYPEPYNDEPPDYHMPPIMDFNHTRRCNTCGYFFGGDRVL